MDVKIGIQQAPREITLETEESAEALTEFFFYDDAGQKLRCRLDPDTGTWVDEHLDDMAVDEEDGDIDGYIIQVWNGTTR